MWSKALGQGFATMGPGELAHDRQAQAAARPAPGGIAAVEPVEDPFRGARREARPVVADEERDPVGRPARLEPDVAARRGHHRQGVLDQVAQDPVDGHPIGAETQVGRAGQRTWSRHSSRRGQRTWSRHSSRPRCRLADHHQLDTPADGACPEALDRLVEERSCVDLLGSQSTGAGPQPIHRVELGNEPLEPVRLLADRARRLDRLGSAGGAISNRAGESADHGEWCPEVVAQVGEQAFLAFTRGRQFAGHRIEVFGQLTDLTRALHGDGSQVGRRRCPGTGRRGGLARRRDRRRRMLEAAQWPGDGA